MLLDRLKAEQGGATDEAFAGRLGITRPTWTAIKLGRVALEGRVLLKISRRAQHEFPHLWRLILDTLLPPAAEVRPIARRTRKAA